MHFPLGKGHRHEWACDGFNFTNGYFKGLENTTQNLVTVGVKGVTYTHTYTETEDRKETAD